MDRCSWAQHGDERMRAYHDEEFGRRKHSDTALFEKLCLEAFQAGLSWRTVLDKRAAFREAFFGFDVKKVAQLTEDDTEALMGDPRIIRNRRKIEAVIHNARLMSAQFGPENSFVTYVYGFDDGTALSRDLKARGFRFAGPVVCASFLGSVGAVEAHEPGCFLYGRTTPCRRI